MSKFNQLYHILLENIINQNNATRQAMLMKSNISNSAMEQWLNYFKRLNNNKLADFLCRYVADETLVQGLDERIITVQKILKLNDSIDTQNFKGTLDQFIKQYQPIIQAKREKDRAKSIQQLDKIPQFTQKKQFKNGVVIYRVEDSLEGQQAVRRIVDLQWGHDANPWCLIARTGDEWDYWTKYVAYPKHIAFQYGQLLAFSANNSEENAWWDRQDQKTKKLVLLDGSSMNTPTYSWSKEDLTKPEIFSLIKGLVYNQQTGRYDSKHYQDLTITNSDLVDGHFPIPLGYIKGSFVCEDCPDLIDLVNGPISIEKNCSFWGCINLSSLEDMPKKINGWIALRGCKSITTLKGTEQFSARQLDIRGTSISNQEKIQYFLSYYKNSVIYNKTTKRYDVDGTVEISEQNVIDGHFPVPFGKVKGIFKAWNVDQLIDLSNGPIYVNGSFIIEGCKNLTSLIGGPKKVTEMYNIYSCESLTTLKGAPQYVGDYFNCNKCSSLISLQGGPKYVGTTFECGWCNSLTSLIGAPQKVNELKANDNPNLVSLEGVPAKLHRLVITNDPKINNLKGLNQVDEVVAWESYGLKNLSQQQKEKYNVKIR